MTVSYQYKVASSTSGGFTRLLFMWRGGLFKLIYRELLIFIIAFDILSLLYHNLLTHEQKEVFERIVEYCDTFIELIPLTFILGFYVAYVAARWWQQYQAIPWPDKCMHTIALYIPGRDEQNRLIRRTLMRYLNLTLVLILRCISSAVKKRFPNLDKLTEVGFMTQTEKQMFLSIPNSDFNTYWVPCAWFINVLQETKARNPNIDPIGVKLIMEQFNEFRAKCGLLWSYDWISIPLVYTQVVTLATYSFFLVAIVGRQYVEDNNNPKKMQMKIDKYLPVFTILQFFFFMGLLKVAEQLINPFGDDDEDFELNWLIDRHTKVSYLGVDTLMLQCPKLEKDKYFDDSNLVLPYTEASKVYKKKTYRGSVHYLEIPEEQQKMFLPEIVEENDEDVEPQVKATRRSSIFQNPFRRRSSGADHNFGDDDDEENKRSFTDEMNGKYQLTSPTSMFNRKDEDTPTSLNHISVISPLENSSAGGKSRRPAAKHNSMLYASSSRKAKCTVVNERRRKSVPAVLSTRHKSSVLVGDAAKYSSRRESADTQNKGFRWKPFSDDAANKHEETFEALDVRSLPSCRSPAGSDFSYLNPSYANSPPETRAANAPLADGGTRFSDRSKLDVSGSANQDCDSKNRTSPAVHNNNPSSHDSLV